MSLNFEKHAQKGNQFLRELAAEFGDKSDINRAGRILRSVFHALRNHLTLAENFQLISQLPMALKGVYIDGWVPGRQKIKSRRKKIDFIMEIIGEDTAPPWKDFATVDDVYYAVGAVLKVMSMYVSEGEFGDIVAVLPKEIKKLVREAVYVYPDLISW